MSYQSSKNLHFLVQPRRSVVNHEVSLRVDRLAMLIQSVPDLEETHSAGRFKSSKVKDAAPHHFGVASVEYKLLESFFHVDAVELDILKVIEGFVILEVDSTEESEANSKHFSLFSHT